MQRILVGVVCFVFVVLAGCSSTQYISFIPEQPKVDVVKQTHIPYPILLLHGLGQKAMVWDEHAVSFYQKEMGLGYGGMLTTKQNKAILEDKSNNGYYDFFTVSFKSPTDSIANWGKELEQYVNIVRAKTKAEKVILIGYSMGGLASRYYLTHNLKDHHVKRLITIGTPHLGSSFARVWKWKSSVTEKLKQFPNPITEKILEATLSVLKAAEQDVPFDSPAVHDLMRPEDGGKFLESLSMAEHPGDVEYISVVGDVDVVDEVKNLNTTTVQEILRRALEFMDGDVGAVLSGGDGVVSTQSQTMNNIAWFKTNPTRQRLTRTVTLKSLHSAHLKNSHEIQRITLEDKPEYKGAEFYRINNQAYLAIDFTDYLPANRSTVTVQYPSFAGERTTTAKDIQLLRKQNGETIFRALLPIERYVNFQENFECTIAISNFFGNKITATKQWIAPK